MLQFILSGGRRARRWSAFMGVVGLLALQIAPAVRADVPDPYDQNRPVTVTLDESARQQIIPLERLTPSARATLASAARDASQVTMPLGHLNEIFIAIMAYTADFEVDVFMPGGAGLSGGEQAMHRYMRLVQIIRQLDEQIMSQGLAPDSNPRMMEIELAAAAAMSELAGQPATMEVHVADTDGTPLDDVLLEITLSRPSSTPFGSSVRDLQQIRVSGTHVVKSDSAWRASFRAFKEGYYRDATSLDLQEDIDRAAQATLERRIWADALNGRKTTRQQANATPHTVTLRLQKHGEPVFLQSIGGGLRFNDNGASTVTSLDIDENHPVQLDVRGEKCTRRVPLDPHGTQNLGPDVVSIHTSLDEDGLIADLVIVGEVHNERHFPRELILKMHDPEGGFILHDASGERESTERRYVMHQAPESGYTAELRLTAEQLSEDIDFFLLNQGRYGKGRLVRPRVTRDKRAVEAGFLVWLNRTPGDRNLEDAREANDQLNLFH